MRKTIAIAMLAASAACVPTIEAPRGTDPCGAHAQAARMGGPAAAIPEAAAGQTRRIIRPGDSVTEDFSDQRINYYLDAADRVVRITCG